MKKKKRRITEYIGLGIGVAIVMIVLVSVTLPIVNASVNGVTWSGTVKTLLDNTLILTAVLPIAVIAAAIMLVFR